MADSEKIKVMPEADHKPAKVQIFPVKEERLVYRLRFELVDRFYGEPAENLGFYDEGELTDFLRLAKAEKGVSRTVLVPGSMNLHAMSYMILRMFGFMNEHLHSFELPDTIFNDVTDGGRIGKWMALCGVIFRYPVGEDNDFYWDDDYEASESMRSWQKRKYTDNFIGRSTDETFIKSLEKLKELSKGCLGSKGKFMQMSKRDAIKDLYQNMYFEDGFWNMLERLKVSDIFLTAEEASAIDFKAWRNHMTEGRENKIRMIKDNFPQLSKRDFLWDLGELKYWRLLKEDIDRELNYGHREKLTEHLKKDPDTVMNEAKDKISELEKEFFPAVNIFDPIVIPFTNSIFYKYDYGDGWCFKITCEERYQNSNGYYFDSNDSELTESDPAKLDEIIDKGAPVCIYADGMNLVDDVGGINGFYEMLQTLAGNDEQEKREMKIWSKGQGWTGRISKPEKIL